MARSPSFCGVILAAGESSRMGRDKALLPWPPSEPPRFHPSQLVAELGQMAAPARSQTFLSAAIELLRPHAEMVMVVAGRNADALAPTIYARGAFLLVNPDPARGQFSSLQVGLQEVLSRGRDAAVVTLVDRPPCRPETVEALCAAFRHAYEQQKWAVVPEFEGKHGHPIVIGREMIEAFLKAPPSSTARDVEHSLQPRIQYLPVDDPWVVANVDTPEQYERLQVP